MKQLTKTVCSALLLASSALVVAGEYPASDFKPKVVYSDASAAPSASAPAAKASVPVVADANFPAANYQPKVVFSDSGYKHSSAAPSASAAKSSAVVAETTAVTAASEPAAENNNHLFGLLGLAVVGFFLYNQKSGNAVAKPASSSTVDVASDGATGVERYLEKQGINKTGVAKYLEKQTSNPATGVAKYVAKQKIKDREAAEARKTGVEKYLRDKV